MKSFIIVLHFLPGKILTPLSREQIGYCSTLNVPYKGEKDPVNQNVWCFPWDIIDPNTSQCYKREGTNE